MKKIVINCNDCFALYTFRLDLLKELRNKYELYIIARRDNYYRLLVVEGFSIIDSSILSSKKNIFKDLKLVIFYRKIFRKIKPDIIVNYTIKPHLYGTIASRRTKVINFVSGVGSVFLKHNLIFHFSKCIYGLIAKKVDMYVFLNKDDYLEFKKYKFIKNDFKIINGEGVTLNNFYHYVDYSLPETFIFIGRLIKEKGILDYLEAAKIIKKKYPKTRFLVAGAFYDKDTVIDKDLLYSYEKEGIIEYLEYSYEINKVLRDVHVVVLPSYREGLPISLIEGLASKKVIIATDVSGNREVCIDGYNGYLVNVKDPVDIARAMEEYISLENKELMHENALKSSLKYDKAKYVNEMVDIIEKI